MVSVFQIVHNLLLAYYFFSTQLLLFGICFQLTYLFNFSKMEITFVISYLLPIVFTLHLQYYLLNSGIDLEKYNLGYIKNPFKKWLLFKMWVVQNRKLLFLFF